MAELSRLEKVDLRKIWKNEALDFTTWLAQEKNLSLLGDEIGIELHLIETEASVGRYNLDVLAEETDTGKKVIIENQLEITDHNHLGKIITYASGFDASLVIWIVQDVRDEHKQAIDWLNEHTDENVNFFIIKMEVWQIEDSPPAAKFQIISKPNDWAKAVKKSASAPSKLTATKLLQLDFWNAFIEYVHSKKTTLKLKKARPQQWYSIAIGSSDAHIDLTVNTQKNEISVDLYIKNSKELYYFLEKHRAEIEKKLGFKMQWLPLEGKKASKIKISKHADVHNADMWEEFFEWMKDTAEKSQTVFYKYIVQYQRESKSLY